MLKRFFLFFLLTTSLIQTYGADYVVTSSASVGAGTFHEAIETANASNLLRLFVIEFDLPPGTVLSNPAIIGILRPVLIDGTTMPGYQGIPLITYANTGGTIGIGLSFRAGSDGSIVRGMQVKSFSIGIEVFARNCTIEKNVLGRNTHAIWLRRNSIQTHIRSNIIGLDSLGLDLGSNADGIIIDRTADAIIGGPEKSDGNIISGNIAKGIWVKDGCTNILIENNIIGTDILGRYAVGNKDGIFIEGTSGAIIRNNLISGNTSNGVYLHSGTGDITLSGNLIGTDIAGIEAVPNSYGILSISIISGLAPPFTGTLRLGEAGKERNVISGNVRGISFSYGKIYAENNYIGLNRTGTAMLGNKHHGIHVSYTNNCEIGNGQTDGINHISGNDSIGVFLTYVTGGIISKNIIRDNKHFNIVLLSSGNSIVQKNYIGLEESTQRKAQGLLRGDGINIIQSSSCLIGGPAPEDGNVISGNHNALSILNCSDNTIRNNIIGLDINGINEIPNNNGVYTTGNGSLIISDNLIAGNYQAGIELTNGGLHTISNNKIGINASGREYGNGEDGIRLINIGGAEVKDNSISSNELSGISLIASNGNRLYGNRIGTDMAGIANLRNKGHGVELKNGSNDNRIGGTGSGQANIIAFNMGSGVWVEASAQNLISANAIYANLAEKAIDLNLDADPLLQGNTGKSKPVISSVTLSSGSLLITGTTSAIGDTVQLFSSDNDGEDAFEFLSAYTTLSDASQNWSATIPLSVLSGGYFVATATDLNHNTSQMSDIVGISNCPTQKPAFTITVPCPDKPLYTGKFVDFELTNFEEGYYYDWDMDDNTSTVVETTDFLSYPFQREGDKDITVTKRLANCAVVSDPQSLTVSEFRMETSKDRICRGEVAQLHVEPDDLPAGSYTWYRNNAVITGQNGPSLSVDKGGTYKVEIQAWNCEESGQGGGDMELLVVGLADDITEGTASKTILILERICIPPPPPCECLGQFQPEPGKDYIISLWVREDVTGFVETYQRAGVKLDFGIKVESGMPAQKVSLPAFYPDPEEPIMDGWQRIQAEFRIPENIKSIDISLLQSSEVDIYYDDIRIHPVEANPKTYVYDPQTLRLMAILDENNYATLYEYDQEGQLIRVKKETERGIMTIQENFNNIHKTGLE